MYGIKNKQLTSSGQVTTKVTAGTNTLSAPARVLQLSIRCGATLGRVDLIDNGAGGTVKYTVPTPAIGAGEDEGQMDDCAHALLENVLRGTIDGQDYVVAAADEH